MDENKDKFNSGTAFQIVFWITGVISPVLMVMYFAGHKTFVLDILKWCLALVVIGPILNATGAYRLIMHFVRHRDDKRWSKINQKAAEKERQKERSKKLKHRRDKDPNLPKHW